MEGTYIKANVKVSDSQLSCLLTYIYVRRKDHVETRGKDGELIRSRVDKMFLDLTDRENLAFRYVL